MRIIDTNGRRIDQPDLRKGRLKRDRVFVKHHEAVDAVAEEGHWQTIKEYPNGGKEVEWIVDVPGVKASEAWDEYEDIFRFEEYDTENTPSLEERVEVLEYQMTELIQLLTKNGGE